MEDTIHAAHLRNVDTWDSGGGVELDILELDDGSVLVVGDETVTLLPLPGRVLGGGRGRRRGSSNGHNPAGDREAVRVGGSAVASPAS